MSNRGSIPLHQGRITCEQYRSWELSMRLTSDRPVEMTSRSIPPSPVVAPALLLLLATPHIDQAVSE